MKPTIIVTGRDGQLGSELQSLHLSYPQYQWIFVDKAEMDLSSKASIDTIFTQYSPTYVVNCAAYTAVDKAETEREIAQKINGDAVGYIAENCKKIGATLIQISTDYVFDGNGTVPYEPAQATAPINFYGESKRVGEELAIAHNPKTIIIRTAWVYSSFGANFVKTMLRLMSERSELNVVSDQIGSPTYARDLANAIIKIILQEDKKYGIYHFTNRGIISWFDFASSIRDIAGLHCTINPITSDRYPTPAKRPKYSVLDKASIERDYQIDIKDWQESLRACMHILAPIA